MSNKSIAIKRINKDIIEITKNPIEGIGLASIDEDPMRYVINIRLMEGPYEGYCLQLLLIFSDTYPTRPPKILIYPNQAIDGQYHHHIFEDEEREENGHHFKKFCFDLLDNDFMETTGSKTGWNPSYSISSLLLQVQNFISDPDKHVPRRYLIEELMNSMNTYTRTFNIIDEKGKKVQIIHTWKNPYPPMYFNQKEESKEKSKEKDKNEVQTQLIKENLTCFMLKVNYLDDPDILLGYPIISQKQFLTKRVRLELYPIPELLTYDGYKAQKSIQSHMVEEYFELKSANNECYDSWLPIYINKDHYQKNKQKILKSIASITSNQEFQPEQIFQVLPIILNSMIIGICKGITSLSSSFIKCYFHFILLFKKICEEYNAVYSIYLNKIFNHIVENNYSVNKQIIPDIGNFFMVLLFNNLEINTDTLKKIYNSLFEDFIVRQMSWMFHSQETRDEMEDIILNEILNKSYLDEFENNKSLIMAYLNEFNEDIHKKNIYQNIIDIISNDPDFLSTLIVGKESAKEQVEIRIKQCFKDLFLSCSKEGKDKLREIILKNLNFSDYFEQRMEKETELYDLYDNFQVHELLKNLDDKKKEELLKYAFENQKGNKLLLITFFAQKKVKEKGFLEELENNYGVYLDVDNFIKELNIKLDEIKSYKALFEYVEADFIKDEKDKSKYKYKNELELIIDSYKKALEKKYIRTKPKQQEQQMNNAINNPNNNIINNPINNPINNQTNYQNSMYPIYYFPIPFNNNYNNNLYNTIQNNPNIPNRQIENTNQQNNREINFRNNYFRNRNRRHREERRNIRIRRRIRSPSYTDSDPVDTYEFELDRRRRNRNRSRSISSYSSDSYGSSRSYSDDDENSYNRNGRRNRIRSRSRSRSRNNSDYKDNWGE